MTQSLDQVERHGIEAAMREYGPHRKLEAAQALGISLKTLYLKLKQHGLTEYVQAQAPKRRAKA